MTLYYRVSNVSPENFLKDFCISRAYTREFTVFKYFGYYVIYVLCIIDVHTKGLI